jgi:glycosyltransferase involved in cell wall biosynthesis
VSEELLTAFRDRRAVTLLMRGSSHIRVQDALLREEEARSGETLDRPSAWMIERELREYALADHVLVLSTFARRTFIDEGVSSDRVSMLPLGVDVSSFRVTEAEREARVQRILGADPLRVLYVGAWSLRKGMIDLLQAARTLRDEPFEFRLVGPAMPETTRLLAEAPASVRPLGKRPQHQLAADYAAADVFLFPTIEDGFGMVLTQAMAAGLPCLTTPNGAGPDFVDEGRNGWIVPIRQPDAIVERLRWCSANRGALAAMVKKLDGDRLARDWSDVGRDFVTIGRELLATKGVHRSQVAQFRPRAKKSELSVHGD